LKKQTVKKNRFLKKMKILEKPDKFCLEKLESVWKNQTDSLAHRPPSAGIRLRRIRKALPLATHPEQA